MKKHLWAIMAGVCVLALPIVAGASVIPRLFADTHSHGEDVVMIPGHWRQAEITGQQRSILETLWGENVTAAQLLKALWPDVLQQMPEGAAITYDKHPVSWPAQSWMDWQGEMIAGGAGVPHDDGTTAYHFYLGTRDS